MCRKPTETLQNHVESWSRRVEAVTAANKCDVIKVPAGVIVLILPTDDYIVGTHFVSNEVALLGNHADDKVTRLSIVM